MQFGRSVFVCRYCYNIIVVIIIMIIIYYENRKPIICKHATTTEPNVLIVFIENGNYLKYICGHEIVAATIRLLDFILINVSYLVNVILKSKVPQFIINMYNILVYYCTLQVIVFFFKSTLSLIILSTRRVRWIHATHTVLNILISLCFIIIYWTDHLFLFTLPTHNYIRT